jgi:hypothetical protein
VKKLSLILVIAFLLAGGAIAAMSAPSYAQGYGGYNYPPPPKNPYATPWVGPNTPWVYYNGDWFLNGVLQYFFGNQYGWAPYYAYPPTYIVRPNNWYEPRWNTWYQQHPQYWQRLTQKYPYWRGHHAGQRYDQDFYNKHHRGQGGKWQKEWMKQERKYLKEQRKHERKYQKDYKKSQRKQLKHWKKLQKEEQKYWKDKQKEGY